MGVHVSETRRLVAWSFAQARLPQAAALATATATAMGLRVDRLTKALGGREVSQVHPD